MLLNSNLLTNTVLNEHQRKDFTDNSLFLVKVQDGVLLQPWPLGRVAFMSS